MRHEELLFPGDSLGVSSLALWSRRSENPNGSTGQLACLFTRTAHILACSALLASLARSTALFHSLARSLTHSLPSSWESESLDGCSCCVFFLFWTIETWQSTMSCHKGSPGPVIWRIHYGSKPGRFETSKHSLNHELGSEWVGEWANERTDEWVARYLRPNSWLFRITAVSLHIHLVSRVCKTFFLRYQAMIFGYYWLFQIYSISFCYVLSKSEKILWEKMNCLYFIT